MGTDPPLFACAVENVRRNQKESIVKLYNCALGAQPAQLHLIRGQLNSGDNRMRRTGVVMTRTVTSPSQ